MITFKNITLEDKGTITKYTMKSSRRNCDLSFANLCSWRFLYNTQFAEAEGFLLLKFWEKGKLAYMMPVGEGDLKKVIAMLIEDAHAEKGKFCMLGVCTEMKKELEDIMPGRFSFFCDRNYADYIYLRDDLAMLTGKKYQPKRNHINKFKKVYDYQYMPITPDLVEECIRLEAEWCKVNNCNQYEGTGNERQAISYAMANFGALGLTGGALCVDNKIVAFTYGMPINDQTFGVHAEKADTTLEGTYAMINNEFVKHIPEQYIYINREEDLGIEGLRKAKLSYHPVTVLEKSMACLKEE